MEFDLWFVIFAFYILSITIIAMKYTLG